MGINKWPLRVLDAVTTKDYIWYSNQTFNGLFRTSIETLHTEFVAFFPDDDLLATGLHYKCFLYGEYLIFLPWLSNKIHLYNMNSGKFSAIELDCDRACFSDVVKVDDYLLLFPFFSSGHLYKFDLKLMHAVKVDAFNDSVKENIDLSEGAILSYSYCMCDKKVFFAVADTGYIAVWDIAKEVIETMHVTDERLNILSVCGGRYFVGSSSDSVLYELNLSDYSFKQICGDVHTIHGKESPIPYYWSFVWECNGRVFANPWNADGIYELDENDLIKRIELSDYVVFDENVLFPVFMCWKIVSDQVWIFPCRTDCLILLDDNMEFVRKKPLECGDLSVCRELDSIAVSRIMQDNPVLVENPSLGIERYLNAIVMENK